MARKGSSGVEPRILIYDIETAPNLGWTWGKWEQNVLDYVQEWYILCFAYKWLGDDDVTVVSLPQFRSAFKADKTDDSNVVAKLHQLFTEADIIVAHNGNSFDQKKTNARFLIHGFDPPSHYKQIDTKLVARKHFNFNSNSLNDLGKTLGLGEKEYTGGFDTWLGCMEGDKESWEIMTTYNAQDVRLLEQVYLRMRPWIDGHPNVALLTGRLDACPKCGSSDVTRQGYKYNRTTTVQQWKCQSCGGWASSRTSERMPLPTLVS